MQISTHGSFDLCASGARQPPMLAYTRGATGVPSGVSFTRTVPWPVCHGGNVTSISQILIKCLVPTKVYNESPSLKTANEAFISAIITFVHKNTFRTSEKARGYPQQCVMRQNVIEVISFSFYRHNPPSVMLFSYW